MPRTPRFRYFLASTDYPVGPTTDIWERKIPISRHPNQDNDQESSIRYQEYFTAVRDFLSDTLFDVIPGISYGVSPPDLPEAFDDIRIFLEKHGEFYHPSRVDVSDGVRQLRFVVNVAVSPAGLDLMDRELSLLTRLNKSFSFRFLPKVHASGTISLTSGRFLKMFIGEWFDGFHEFHLTVDPSDGKQKLSIWDSDNNLFYLSKNQSDDVYRQSARILSYYYDVEAVEQIFSWHHGAGDFIVRPVRDDAVDMRLITVRKYAPLFSNFDKTPEAMLQALLIFFISLSIRNRLDRLDGVGSLTMASLQAVNPTVEGFFHGLALKIEVDSLPPVLVDTFKSYLGTLSESDLFDLAHTIMDRYPENSPEKRLVNQALKGHTTALHQAVSEAL